MESISLTANWLPSKPIESCIFVKFVTQEVNHQNGSDSGPNDDIETLLQSYENCVQFREPIQVSGEEPKECKLSIKTINESENDLMPIIDSFSMLCSAKIIEIHGNESNEYLKTLFNELIEELDGLSMFRSDYHFTEQQKEITITFKNFKELWIYGLVIKLIRVNRKPVTSSKEVPSFSSIFNMMSMFSNSSKNSSSDDLIHKLSEIKTTDEMGAKSDEQIVLAKSRTVCTKFDPIVATNSETIDENKINSSEEKLCECLCHKNCDQIAISDTNTDFLCQYIDKKVSDLEKSIENKLNSLENKMFSVFNLFINKQ